MTGNVPSELDVAFPRRLAVEAFAHAGPTGILLVVSQSQYLMPDQV
jgi:hypothetical protein